MSRYVCDKKLHRSLGKRAPRETAECDLRGDCFRRYRGMRYHVRLENIFIIL